jgi:hypothetical protein
MRAGEARTGGQESTAAGKYYKAGFYGRAAGQKMAYGYYTGTVHGQQTVYCSCFRLLWRGDSKSCDGHEYEARTVHESRY